MKYFFDMKRIQTVRFLTVIGFGLILNSIISCEQVSYTHQYTTDEPLVKEVVGFYEYDFQNLDDSLHEKFIRGRRPFMVINPDKTFTIHGLPTFKEIKPREFKADKPIVINGKWRIAAIGSIDKTKTHWGMILDGVPDNLQSAGFLGTESPRGIIFIFGDPEDGKIMLLKKK